MQKAFCNMTLKDLLDYLKAVQEAQEMAGVRWEVVEGRIPIRHVSRSVLEPVSIETQAEVVSNGRMSRFSIN